MNPTNITSVFYTLIPTGAVLLALLLGLSCKPKGLMINFIQAFSAGILLASIAVDLLPQLNFSRYGISLSISMLAGLLLMLGLAQLSPNCCSSENKTAPLLPFTTGFALEFFINGAVIVLSTLAGQFVSIVVAISLGICCFVCGLAVVTHFISVGLPFAKVTFSVFFMALLFPIGGIVAYLFISHLSTMWSGNMIAFGMAILLYIITTDLLVGGFKPKSHWSKILFYLGFLIILWIKATLGG